MLRNLILQLLASYIGSHVYGHKDPEKAANLAADIVQVATEHAKP